MENLIELLATAKNEIQAAQNQARLNELRAYYLGKKSPLQAVLKEMATLAAEEKRILGQNVNDFKSAIEGLIAKKRQALTAEAIAKKLSGERLDVTLPGRIFPQGSLHPLTQMVLEVSEWAIK